MEHHFNVELADEYGIYEAIIIECLYYWIKKNEANKSNYKDGSYWTYNSIKALKILFPYMTGKKIYNTIQKLIDYGLIKKGNYNTSTYDRTLWYSFTDLGIEITEKVYGCHFPKKENGFSQKGRPIPLYIPLKETIIINNNSKEKQVFFRDESLNNLFIDFLELRKKKKVINTDKAIKLLLNKLNKYNDDVKRKMLETSIINSWSSVYEPKPEEIKKERKIL